ncbi:DUF1741-domain-containing protein [Ascodesmis nigricans]|uniref:DUF1741-domain-containing protein n=1 Tax=Ascodesmis nigricans TaxID=341454 RepID=A0A4S2N6F0_9PEZI|nr:DUF1741-domain-containing protein [Ascodesmis nigricans]
MALRHHLRDLYSLPSQLQTTTPQSLSLHLSNSSFSAMAAITSPLTQDRRPSFQPKIVSLYEALFKDDDPSPPCLTSPGFWTEFFLLRPHPPSLRSILDPLSGDDLPHLQPVTRILFRRSVDALQGRKSPQDEIALETLQLFLGCVLKKKYTNASSEVIAVLTGLDEVDNVMEGLVDSLEGIIRGGRTVELRRKAVQVALCVACGAFNTGLLSYFTHRDLFPALMKYINDPSTTGFTYEPLLTLALLSNYNKFEFQNPYQLRLDDFVNENTIKQIVQEVGMTCIRCRSDYVSIMDDLPEGWSLGSVLSYVGLSIFAGADKAKKPPPTPQNAELIKAGFGALPHPQAALLLATYDWVNSNMLFCHSFVNHQNPDPKVESPICAYLSFTSYILHHAHRSTRCGLYARLNLFVLRILLEDQGICKRLTSDETKGFVRLCRQKPPHLPLIRGKRLLLTAVIDLVADGINHNLKKKLDVDLYIVSLTVLHRAITFLIRTRTRLEYHWSELWRSLLTLLRFLTTYATDLQQQFPTSSLSSLIFALLSLTVLCLTSGDSFLANAAEYDDLFYKLVEAGDTLQKFRDAWTGVLSATPGAVSNSRTNGGSPIPGRATPAGNGLTATVRMGKSIDVLIKVSEHYWKLIEENRGKKGGTLSPDLVKEVIKTGYETLEIGDGQIDAGKDGLGELEKWRESEERAVLKRIARMAVDDLGVVLEEGSSVSGI